MLAISRLAKIASGAILHVFRRSCASCGGNHYERAAQILRVVKYIHPDAIDMLRSTMVPERMLRDPFFQDDAIQIPSDPEELEKALSGERRRLVRRTLRLRGNIPVWRTDSERTRIVQIAFAHQYKLRKDARSW